MTVTTFAIAAAVFGIALAGMAIGVLVSGRRIKGTCGGLANMRDRHGNPICDACSNPAEDCADFRAEQPSGSRM